MHKPDAEGSALLIFPYTDSNHESDAPNYQNITPGPSPNRHTHRSRSRRRSAVKEKNSSPQQEWNQRAGTSPAPAFRSPSRPGNAKDGYCFIFSQERERPDEQDYLSGLWRDCDFTACVCRSISVVKDFFRAEFFQFQPRIVSPSCPAQHVGSIDSEGLIVLTTEWFSDDRTVVRRVWYVLLRSDSVLAVVEQRLCLSWYCHCSLVLSTHPDIT